MGEVATPPQTVDAAAVETPPPAAKPKFTLAQWMKELPDDRPLADVNIPGTHDSGAIARGLSRLAPFHLYSRQSRTIAAQLRRGVRLLDLRIQVTQVPPSRRKKRSGARSKADEKLAEEATTNGTEKQQGKEEEGEEFAFHIVHGAVLNSINLNRYQTLASLLAEVADFLDSYPSEAVVASLKIDSWKGFAGADQEPAHARAVRALRVLLNRHARLFAALPARPPHEPAATYVARAPLGEVRGKLLLFNRIPELNSNAAPADGVPAAEDDGSRGGSTAGHPDEAAIPVVPFNNPDNPPGALLEGTAVYVQDQYEGLAAGQATADKLRLVNNGFDYKAASAEPVVVWSFASATRQKLFLVNVHYGLLKEIGSVPLDGRRKTLGWILFDFAVSKKFIYFSGRRVRFPVDVVSLVVESNFNYAVHPDEFNVFSVFQRR